MTRKVIVVRMTYDGKECIGKCEVKLYEDDQPTQDANVGMTLHVRRQIKAVSAGGKEVNLSAVESV